MPQPRAVGVLNHVDTSDSVSNYYLGERERAHLVVQLRLFFIYIYLYIYRPFWPPGGPALRANVAGQITRASTLYMYTYIRMYIHGQSNNASHGNDKRGYGSAKKAPPIPAFANKGYGNYR